MVSGDDQTATAGTALPDSLVVRATDAGSNPVAGVTVTWTVTGGGAVSATTVTTGADGRSAVRRTLGPAAGPQSTMATAAGLDGSPVTFSATATVGSATQSFTVSARQVGQSGSATITVTIDGVSFSGNKAVQETGGAIHIRYGDLTVKNSTFNNNNAGAGGGAIYDRSTPGGWDETTLSISDSTFSGNVSLYGGGVTTGSNLSLDRSTFVNNSGGGMLLDGFGEGDSASVTNSTFSGNDRAIRNGAASRPPTATGSHP